MTRRRRRGSRRFVPPELRLAYGARALTLGHAVLSLLPPAPPPGAPCRTCHSSAGCLDCRRWAHLLREGDPVEYRRLVTRSVCALAPAGSAPPPPRYTPGNGGHSQAKLVRWTIKSIMTDRSCTTKNVLCIVSRESAQSRCVSDLVSSLPWEILLRRIGDLHMCYILRHSSIFLCIKKNDYIQVSGLALNVVLPKPTFASARTRDPQTRSKKEICSMCCMRSKKEMVPKLSGGCVKDSKFGFNSLDANTCKFDALQSSANYGTAGITDPNSLPGLSDFTRSHSISKSTVCSSYTQNSGKRKRLYRWQRYRKRKKFCCEDKSSIVQSKTNKVDFNAGCKVSDEVHSLDPIGDTNSLTLSSDINFSHTKGQCGVDVFDMGPAQCPCDCNASRCQPSRTLLGPASFLHLNTSPICFNCLILNSFTYLSVDSSIPRHNIFYNRRTSYNIFHGNHILNKRRRPDALTLIKHIFGIKECCAKDLNCVSHEPTSASSNYLWSGPDSSLSYPNRTPVVM